MSLRPHYSVLVGSQGGFDLHFKAESSAKIRSLGLYMHIFKDNVYAFMLISLSENNGNMVEVKQINKGNSFVLVFSYHLLFVAYLYIIIIMQFIQ